MLEASKLLRNPHTQGLEYFHELGSATNVTNLLSPLPKEFVYFFHIIFFVAS